MRDILRDTNIGFDLVEEIPSVGVFERDPSPEMILIATEELDDVVMAVDMAVKSYLVLDLFRAESAFADSPLLVDEFDGDDIGGILMEDGFSDAGRADRSAREALQGEKMRDLSVMRER